jgi:hypothetical protein
MNQTVCALGFDYRRKRSVLIIVVIIAPAACADFLTLGLTATLTTIAFDDSSLQRFEART